MYKIWCTVLTIEDYEAKLGIEARYIDDLPQWLKDHQPEVVYINAGINTDSDMPSKVPEEIHYEGYKVDKTSIYPVLCDIKVIKSEAEIDVLRWATKITVEGHIEVLKSCKPGMKEM